LNPNILVSDFDGTITDNDFYALILERHMGLASPDYWARYRTGEITHFEAMKLIFSHAPSDPAQLEDLLASTHPDPEFGAAARRLRDAGWDLTVVSAGSSWYIDRILERSGVSASVHANPGAIRNGQGLVLELPRDSPFFSAQIGIDKSAVVKDALANYEQVAFAGDGPPDIAPALLVGPEMRYARGFLAEELARRKEQYQQYRRWPDIADALLARSRNIP
jgi:2,3-diketo-5-methylthio-1-phosphopentane phosphatase